MEVTLLIISEPFSINKMYYNKGNTKVRTQDARNWSYQVFQQLDQAYNKQQLQLFRDIFDPSKMGIEINIQIRYNDSKLYKKDGTISSSSMDCSNFEKPLIDLLFLPKYFDRTPPDGCKNLKVDDKYILRLISEKKPSYGEGSYMLVTLKTIELENWE